MLHDLLAAWDQQLCYERGALVQCHGKTWICRAEITRCMPGTNAESWEELAGVDPKADDVDQQIAKAFGPGFRVKWAYGGQIDSLERAPRNAPAAAPPKPKQKPKAAPSTTYQKALDALPPAPESEWHERTLEEIRNRVFMYAMAENERAAGNNDELLASVLVLAVKSSAMVLRLSVRCDELQTKLGEIEATGIKYMGVHQRAVDYTRGSVVTHEGSAWVCIVDKTNLSPGDGKTWQLMVKRGQDARA